MFVEMKASAYTPFPPGVYPMRIHAIEDRRAKKTGRLFFIWKIEVEGELPPAARALQKGPRFCVLTDGVLKEQNNFGRFLNAIGIRIRPTMMLRTETLVGHRFTARVDVVSTGGLEHNVINNKGRV